MFRLYSLVAFHFLVIIMCVSALFTLPFVEPWYIAWPLCSLIVNLMFSPIPCPLTRLEDSLRRKLGLREIRHFVGFYIVHPIKKFFRNREWHRRKRLFSE